MAAKVGKDFVIWTAAAGKQDGVISMDKAGFLMDDLYWCGVSSPAGRLGDKEEKKRKGFRLLTGRDLCGKRTGLGTATLIILPTQS